jgi:spermidine synthase
LRRALDLDPASATTHAIFGDTLYQRGETLAALLEWREAIRLAPSYVPALRQAAWVLSTSPDDSIRNGAEAVDFGLRAAQATAGKDPAVLDALAAAYAEAGRFEAAALTARRALLAAPPGQAEEIRGRIALYESRRPFRKN